MKTNEELALLIASIIESKNNIIEQLQQAINERDQRINELESKEE